MKKYRLSVITENQKQFNKAQKVADLIKKDLKIETDPAIRKYDKFPNSYKIEFIGEFNPPYNFISEAVELTNRLASPWNVQYGQINGEVELIFNKASDFRYERIEYNVVRWAIFESE